MARAKRSGRKRKPRKITLPELAGDHGTETDAANQNTEVVEIKEADGSNPNRRGHRRRREAYLGVPMSMRQQQAAKAIRDAHCGVQSLSSGGELKEQVDSTSKPDKVIDIQCAIMSRWIEVTKPLRSNHRAVHRARFIIEHVCCDNEPLRTLPDRYQVRSGHILRVALDVVADHLGY